MATRRGGTTSRSGSTSGSSSGSSGSGSSSGSSSSGSSSSSGGSSGSSSSGSSGGSGGSGGGGQGGASSSKGKSSTSSGQANSPSNATTTSGSSSTTTGANVQTSASVSSPNYSASLGFSSNSLTQGAGSASNIHSPNVSQSFQETAQANTTQLGVKPYVYQAGQISYNPAQSFSQESNLFYAYQGKQIDPNSAQGMQIASILAQQRARNSLLPATNADNTFQQSESASLTNAEQRQKKFVDTNLFRANPTPTPSAPIPDEIYTRTNLYQQAGQRDNPLSILEGNPFIEPQQQFLPQINEDFAPRPAYGAFQSNPYIGVHQNSPIAPNSEAGETQRKDLKDWYDEFRTSKNFYPILIALVLFSGLWLFVLRKRGGGK